ncbi:hypothetical protein ACFXTI_007464 [Malus domestica]
MSLSVASSGHGFKERIHGEREKKAKKKSSSATKSNSKEPIEPIAEVAEPGKCWVTTMFFEEGKMEPTEVEKGRELQFSA